MLTEETLDYIGREGLLPDGYMGGGANPPIADSSRSATASTWTPIGSPSGEVPPRTTTPGQPVAL